jgi:hypothetical protein
MGAITVGGKGSRNRVKDLKGYRENFDQINWPSKTAVKAEPEEKGPAPMFDQQGEPC